MKSKPLPPNKVGLKKYQFSVNCNMQGGTNDVANLILQGDAVAIGKLPADHEIINKKLEYHGFRLTPLLLAVKTNNLSISKILIGKGADLNCTDELIDKEDYRYAADGLYPVHHAAMNGNLDILTLLIESGADANTASVQDGITPFLFSIYSKKSAVTLYLMPLTRNIHMKMRHGENALNLAIGWSDNELVTLLIEKGLDVNNEGPGPWTPLLSAVAKGRYDIARMLIEHGADIYAKANGIWDIHYLAKDKEKLNEILQQCGHRNQSND